MTDTHDETLADDEETEVGVRVRAHPGLCLGYGLCHRFARDVYPLDEDNHIAIHLLDVPAELAYEAWVGASVCPQRAITVIGRPEAYWKAWRDEQRIAAIDDSVDGTPDGSTDGMTP